MCVCMNEPRRQGCKGRKQRWQGVLGSNKRSVGGRWRSQRGLIRYLSLQRTLLFRETSPFLQFGLSKERKKEKRETTRRQQENEEKAGKKKHNC